MTRDTLHAAPKRSDFRPFLVTGSGRCGTGYMAHLLEQLGYPCGHEYAFDWPTVSGGLWVDRFAERQCDSSWLAMPFIAQLPTDAVIFHQVRNPVKVVRSLKGIGFLTPKSRIGTPYARFAASITTLPEDELAADMEFWSAWNDGIIARCEGRTHAMYQLEEIDRELVREMVTLIEPDRVLTNVELDAAFSAVPTNYNTRERDELVTWSSIPDSALKERIRLQAESYGYLLDDLEAA